MPSANVNIEKLTMLLNSKAKIPFEVFQKVLDVDDYTFGAKIYTWSFEFDLPIEDETIRMETPINLNEFIARVKRDVIPLEHQPPPRLIKSTSAKPAPAAKPPPSGISNNKKKPFFQKNKNSPEQHKK